MAAGLEAAAPVEVAVVVVVAAGIAAAAVLGAAAAAPVEAAHSGSRTWGCLTWTSASRRSLQRPLREGGSSLGPTHKQMKG